MANDPPAAEFLSHDFFPERPPVLARSAASSSADTNEWKSMEDVAKSQDDDPGNPRYKTEICRNFKERSKCIYGDSCQFAHGRKELREIIRNTKYKTKRCQKYWMTGYCAYGPRCNFLHNEGVIEDGGCSRLSPLPHSAPPPPGPCRSVVRPGPHLRPRSEGGRQV